MVLQLERELETAAFDPLKDVDSVTVADTSQLKDLSEQVEQAINDEKARTQLVGQLMSTPKLALRAAGVPIPA